LHRYDNWLDTVTWTWEGLTALQVLFYSLTQFNLNCTVQFLDPYIPNAAEIQDSKLFAANVRSGTALDINFKIYNSSKNLL
jgi:lysophosphatidylcholine acyltransferase/lyso-PAF acetyltransferase